jgi:flagellar biosynthetic protein FliQ
VRRKEEQMTPEMVVQLARRSFETTLMLSAPLLIFSLIVGLLISIFQTVTSINEATLAFVPKIVAVMVAMIIFFPWMMSYMSDFTREIFAIIPAMRH